MGHLGGCSRNSRRGKIWPGASGREKAAIGQENPDIPRAKPKSKAVKKVVTARTLKARKKAQQERRKGKGEEK